MKWPVHGLPKTSRLFSPEDDHDPAQNFLQIVVIFKRGMIEALGRAEEALWSWG